MKDFLLSFVGLILLMVALTAFPPLAIAIIALGAIGMLLALKRWIVKRTQRDTPPTSQREPR